MVMLLLDHADSPLYGVLSSGVCTYIKDINTFIYSHRGKSISTHSFIVHHGTDYRQLNSINIEKIGNYVLHDQVNLMEAVI